MRDQPTGAPGQDPPEAADPAPPAPPARPPSAASARANQERLGYGGDARWVPERWDRTARRPDRTPRAGPSPQPRAPLTSPGPWAAAAAAAAAAGATSAAATVAAAALGILARSHRAHRGSRRGVWDSLGA